IYPVRRSLRGGQRLRRAGTGHDVADHMSSWCDLPVGWDSRRDSRDSSSSLPETSACRGVPSAHARTACPADLGLQSHVSVNVAALAAGATIWSGHTSETPLPISAKTEARITRRKAEQGHECLHGFLSPLAWCTCVPRVMTSS